MYDLLAAMYRDGQIDKAYLDQAVKWKWITQAQEDEITGSGGNVGVLDVQQL